MTSEQEQIEASLAFLRSCVTATPLRREAAVFELERVPPKLAAGLVEGLASFESDLARWSLQFESAGQLFAQLQLAANLQATYFYRVSRALFLSDTTDALPIIAATSKLLTGMEIYYSADIGPGMKVIHGVGTVIGAGCVVGSHFTVYQGVTIGDKLGRGTGERPQVGDQVIASAGCQVLGPVEIGNQTVNAGNAAVVKSLPARCVAGGVPARVLQADLDDEAWGEFWASIKG